MGKGSKVYLAALHKICRVRTFQRSRSRIHLECSYFARILPDLILVTNQMTHVRSNYV